MRHLFVGLLFLVINVSVNAQAKLAAGGFHSAQVGVDGRLYTWGDNTYGQLGLGNTGPDRYLPVQLGNGFYWSQVFGGVSNTFAIRTDGTLWGWGRGTEGQIGDGNQADKNVPSKVGFDTNWKTVSSYGEHTAAIKTTNALWIWGSNSDGQLGDGTTNTSPVPEQVPGTWKAVAVGAIHTIAIKTDGSLWAWGGNTAGQLGRGTLVPSLVPIRIGTANDWDTVVVAENHSFATKTNHTLYAWGDHQGGVLGLGSTGGVDVLAPQQVGTATDWSKVSAGESHAVALKTSGAFYVWGINVAGEFGTGSTPTGSDVPLLNSAVTNATAVFAGTLHTLTFRGASGNVCSAGYNEEGAIGNGAGPGAPDQTTFLCIAGAPLPLTLLDFNGHLVNTNALLKWKTTNEQSTLSFEVERSITKGVYERVGTVSATSTPGEHEYSLTDYNVTDLKESVVYYRLKQIDVDGHFTYSNVIPVVLDKKSLIRLFPNPAREQVNISITVSARDKAIWQIHDLGGRTLMQGSINLDNGTTNIPVDVSRLPRGMYVVSVQGTIVNQQLQLIKQ